MNDVGRDVNRDFGDRIDLIPVDAERGRFPREEERSNRRNHDLEPHRLVRRFCGCITADDVVPHRLERGRKVRREGKRTAGIFKTGNVNLLSHRLFIRYIL